MEYQLNDDVVILNLNHHLEIETIQEQKQIYLDVIKQNKPIRLLAENISRIDTASLQLMVSFMLMASELNIQLSWMNPSLSLQKSVRLLGLSEALKLPIA